MNELCWRHFLLSNPWESSLDFLCIQITIVYFGQIELKDIFFIVLDFSVTKDHPDELNKTWKYINKPTILSGIIAGALVISLLALILVLKYSKSEYNDSSSSKSSSSRKKQIRAQNFLFSMFWHSNSFSLLLFPNFQISTILWTFSGTPHSFSVYYFFFYVLICWNRNTASCGLLFQK